MKKSNVIYFDRNFDDKNERIGRKKSYLKKRVKMINRINRKKEKKRNVREREKERFTVTLVLLYLHAQPTYTVQSTEQPDTHFRHLSLDPFGDQCFHSTLCRQWWLKVYEAITCNTIVSHVWVEESMFISSFRNLLYFFKTYNYLKSFS